MFLLAVLAISLGLFSVGEGVVTIGTPVGASVVGTNPVPEDTTAVFVVQALAATTGATSVDAYNIVSQDGSTTTADFKFETNKAANGLSADLQTKATATFDYEMKPSYVLVIEVVDDVPDTATVTVTAEIGDLDDNTPTFSQVLLCGAVPALSNAGFAAGNFPATDLDGTAAMRAPNYLITGGDDTGALKFDAAPTKGEILRTSVALDTAVKSVYSLVMEARGPTNTATATIVVTVGGTCGACGSGAQTITSAASILASLLGFMLYQFV